MTWLDSGIRAFLLAQGTAVRWLREELDSLEVRVRLTDGCIEELAREADLTARREMSSGGGASYAELLRAQLIVQASWVRRWTTTDEKAPADDSVAHVQAFVGEPVDPDVRCLTLLGTAGDAPAWNDRRRSQGHQAIPLPSDEVVQQLPMVLQLITELGLEVTTVVRPDPRQARALAQQTYDVFHVADAVTSPYVPAKDFVQEHGIVSALGFGGMLYTGDFYAVVMFSKVAVSADTAQMLKILSLPVRVPLLEHLGRVFTG